MKVHRTRHAAALVAGIIALTFAAATPASAAATKISGTVDGTIEALGIPVPIPSAATFAGSLDQSSGVLNATVASDPVALQLPVGDGTASVGATFANPGGFTGTAKGTTATLNGSVKLTLTELSAPGVEIPIPIAMLGCSLTFPLQLTGTWNAATGVIDVAQSNVSVPQLPMFCALGIQTATGVDVNAALADLPPGSVALRLAITAPTWPPTTPPVAPTAAEAFVIAAYQDFLHRAPSANELAQASNRPLATAADRSQVIAGLARSNEWITVTVNQLYIDTLGRVGDPSGVAYWVGKLQAGRMSVAQVAATFYSSPEYFGGFGKSSVEVWVRDLYQKVLHRNGDDPGVKYWKSVVAAKGRSSVAYSIYQSPESRASRVTSLYVRLLGRNAEPSGLAYWANQVKTVGDLKLAEQLASSAEYSARAQTRGATLPAS